MATKKIQNYQDLWFLKCSYNRLCYVGCEILNVWCLLEFWFFHNGWVKTYYQWCKIKYSVFFVKFNIINKNTCIFNLICFMSDS